MPVEQLVRAWRDEDFRASLDVGSEHPAGTIDNEVYEAPVTAAGAYATPSTCCTTNSWRPLGPCSC